MRAPASDLPLVLDDVSLQAGATTILDRLSLTIAPGAPTADRSGRTARARPRLLRLVHGARRAVGRPHHLGRPRRSRHDAPRHPVSAPGDAAKDRRPPTSPMRWRRPACRAASAPARIAALLDRVGLSDLAQRPARRLSGGEQQRLALARALARDPEILLLDEPTANLDPAATRGVEEIVLSAARSGIKIVMASHDLGQVRRLAGDVDLSASAARCASRAAAEDFLDSSDDAGGRRLPARRSRDLIC